MIRRCVAAVVGSALAVATPMSAKAAAGEPDGSADTEPRSPGAIRVDVEALGPGYERLQSRVAGEAESAAQQADVASERVEIRIEWLDADSFSYVVHATVAPSDASAKPVRVQDDCRQCQTDAVVKAALDVLEAALEETKRLDAQSEAAGTEEQAESEPPPPTAAEPADTPTRRGALGPMGWGGASLLAAGTIAVAVGATFVALGERTPRDRPIYLRDYQPPGIALLASGGAALITGAVLLGLDLRRSSRAMAGLHFDRSSFGFVVQGVF